MSGSYPGEYKTQFAGLSEREADKQARRVVVALKRGANKTTLRKMGLTDKRIHEIAAAANITIPKGVGGNRL
jgi:hypothetical protein